MRGSGSQGIAFLANHPRRSGGIGRRDGLKHRWGQPHPGSSPGSGTTFGTFAAPSNQRTLAHTGGQARRRGGRSRPQGCNNSRDGSVVTPAKAFVWRVER